MVAKLTIWSILLALGPRCYKMMAFQVSSSTPFRFSAFQASFNDPLRGFGAFLVSFNEPLRGFGTFQVSFNDPSEGLQPSRSLSTTPLRGFEAFQASFNDPLRHKGGLIDRSAAGYWEGLVDEIFINQPRRRQKSNIFFTQPLRW